MARPPADPERALAGRRTVRSEAHVHPQPDLPVDHPDQRVGPFADADRPAGEAWADLPAWATAG